MKTQVQSIANLKISGLLFAGIIFLAFLSTVAIYSAQAAVNDPPTGDDRSCANDPCGNAGSGYPTIVNYYYLKADNNKVFAGQPVTMSWGIEYGATTNQCYASGGFDGWATGSSGNWVSKYSNDGKDTYVTNTPGTYTFNYHCMRPKMTCQTNRHGDQTCNFSWQLGTISEIIEVEPLPQPECSDGIDNADPEDVLVDMNDPGCTDPNDDDETDPVLPPPGPVSATVNGQNCTIPTGSNGCLIGLTWNIQNMIGVPNIFNSTTNTGVHSGVAVQNTTYNYWRQRGTYTIVARDNASIIPGASAAATVTASCEIGSTWNGSICASDSGSDPQCSDGLNNDGDAYTDYPDDPGCTGPDDDDESDGGPDLTDPQCSDGLNNDGDAYTDYPDDPGCTGPDDDDETDTGLPLTDPTIMVDTPFVRQGQDVTVSWDPGGYVGCVLSSNLTSDPYAVTSETVTPTGTSVYTITCGSVSDSARVDVLPAVSET